MIEPPDDLPRQAVVSIAVADPEGAEPERLPPGMLRPTLLDPVVFVAAEIFIERIERMVARIVAAQLRIDIDGRIPGVLPHDEVLTTTKRDIGLELIIRGEVSNLVSDASRQFSRPDVSRRASFGMLISFTANPAFGPCGRYPCTDHTTCDTHMPCSPTGPRLRTGIASLGKTSRHN